MSLYTGNNSGLMSSLFGSYKNSLFGSLSSSLSDYSMIRSGAYGKLMKAYYAKEADTTQKTDKTDKTDKTKKTDKTAQMSTQEKEQLQQMQELKTGAKSLSDAASALQKDSLYKVETAEDGTSAVDRSKITSALKSFVGAYNTYIEQTGKSSKSTVQKQNLSALKATAANSKLLAEVGISYDKKGNLTLDETKAQKLPCQRSNHCFRVVVLMEIRSVIRQQQHIGLPIVQVIRLPEEPDIAARERILLLATLVIYWINCYK